MFLVDKDINDWKNDMHDYQNKRKNVQWEPQHTPKIITHADVKLKDSEYDPIMQKFRHQDKVIDFLSLVINCDAKKEELAVTREKFNMERLKNRALVKFSPYKCNFNLFKGKISKIRSNLRPNHLRKEKLYKSRCGNNRETKDNPGVTLTTISLLIRNSMMYIFKIQSEMSES